LLDLCISLLAEFFENGLPGLFLVIRNYFEVFAVHTKDGLFNAINLLLSTKWYFI